MADLHDSTEHYLSTIFEIEEEGTVIKRARIAERLGISAPSVTEHIHRMEKQGLVKVAPDNSVALTKAGKKVATNVVRRHRLAERLLVDIIGLDWESAHKEADRWEHVISDDVEEKLVKLLGNPETCPHGNPIPNADGTRSEYALEQTKNTVPLSEVTANKAAIIRRIGERIETKEDDLHFVAKHNFIPGTAIDITTIDDNGTTVSQAGSAPIVIPTSVAQSIYVEVSA